MLSPQSWQPTCIGYLRSRTKDPDASFVLIISTKLSKLIGIQSMLALDAAVLTKFVNHTDSLLSRHSMLAGRHNLQGQKYKEIQIQIQREIQRRTNISRHSIVRVDCSHPGRAAADAKLRGLGFFFNRGLPPRSPTIRLGRASSSGH